MDELDKKLFKDLSSEIKVPDKCRVIIKETINKIEDVKLTTANKFIKIMSITCASLVLTTGIVYAGTIVYNSIWKQPEKVIGTNTTIEENCYKGENEEEARNKIMKILEKFGYYNDKIKSITLENNAYDYNLVWKAKTENGINIDLSANNKNYFAISYDENKLLSKNLKKDIINKEQAEIVARELCEKYGYDLSKYNKVVVTPYYDRDDFKFGQSDEDIESNLWNVVFSKIYDDGINSYENIRISFVSGINKEYYFMYENLIPENNPIEITQEQAKQIVLDAEKKIDSNYTIRNIYTNIDIALMNGDAYLRMNNYEQYSKQYYGQYLIDFTDEEYIRYRTESRVRRTWMVTIECERKEKSKNVVDKYYTYYVDATTGEIIGGNSIYYMIKLKY